MQQIIKQVSQAEVVDVNSVDWEDPKGHLIGFSDRDGSRAIAVASYQSDDLPPRTIRMYYPSEKKKGLLHWSGWDATSFRLLVDRVLNNEWLTLYQFDTLDEQLEWVQGEKE